MIPISVISVLRKLGQDINDARRRRRIPVAILAQRASISRTTLNKVENGDPTVSIGIYATILFILGISDKLANLADLKYDNIGLELEAQALPKRIRFSRSNKSKSIKSTNAK